MSKIIRTEPNAVLAKAVEYHGFVFVQGVTASDLSKDVVGQTHEVLAGIDAILETHGTDNTRLLQAQIWLKDIRDRDAMNTVWSALAADRRRPCPRLRAGQHGRPAALGGDHGHRLQMSVADQRHASDILATRAGTAELLRSGS